VEGRYLANSLWQGKGCLKENCGAGTGTMGAVEPLKGKKKKKKEEEEEEEEAEKKKKNNKEEEEEEE
jgi:ribosomal protein L12E/L44/L45/RPP1/RPP2